MNKDIFSPSVIFNAVFLFAVIDAITMINVWKTEIHVNTLLVISVGVFLFQIGALLANKTRRIRLGNQKVHRRRDYKSVNSSVAFAFIVIDVLILLYITPVILNVVRSYGITGSPLYLIGKYSTLSKEKNADLGIGKIASNLHQFCEMQSYVWAYLLLHEFVFIKKIRIDLLVLYIITTLSFFLYGSRGTGVFSLVALIPLFVIMYREKRERKKLPGKYYFWGIALVAVLMFSFQGMGELISRRFASSVTPWEYISIYFGAPIQNLDLYLQQRWVRPKIWGYNTFNVQISYLGRKFNIPNLAITTDIPFNYRNGHILGNTYTMFYAFIYDFRYTGIVITFILGYVMQKMYIVASRESREFIPIARLVYAYFFPGVAFAFFSNKIIESVTITFVKGLIIWIIMSKLLKPKRVC